MNPKSTSKLIRIAAIIAIVGNTLLAVLKIVVGLLSDSSALTADGTDSATDVAISTITLIIVAIINKPADKKHPWGHRRAETIATAFLSFAIFFVGAQFVVTSASALIKGQHSSAPTTAAMIVSGISIAGKILLLLSQYILGKRANSKIIMANAKNMAGDTAVSVSVLIGLLVSRLTGNNTVDKILTILIGLWIIKTAIGIFRETNVELMDGTHNTKVYGIIVEAVDSVEGASNPHRARMRCISGFWDISFDINVSGMISVTDGHAIATRVEDEIKRRLENVFDIMVHIEPSGDHCDEAYGLSEQEMRKS